MSHARTNAAIARMRSDETVLEHSAIRFQTCKTLTGKASGSLLAGETVTACAIFAALDRKRMGTAATVFLGDDPRYYVNLNPIQRRTWRKVLSGQSISSIAHGEGISRKAVYDRIQGNAKGQGGMIAKNFWCLLWWRLRQRQMGATPNDSSTHVQRRKVGSTVTENSRYSPDKC